MTRRASMVLAGVCLPLAMLAAGCVAGGPRRLPYAHEDTCDARDFQSYVGRMPPADFAERVAARRGERKFRTIRDGDTILADYNRDRVNFHIADDGTIESIRCY